MDARRYWGTTKRLASQYKKEADEAVKSIEAKRQSAAAASAHEAEEKRTEALHGKVDFWRSLKAGDAIFSGRVIVAKKNRFSVTSTNSVKYTIEEVIGSSAAALFRKGGQ